MSALRRALASYTAVAAGTVLGGVLRALVSQAMISPGGAAFPWATLLVNVTGSFVIGFYATVTEPGGRLLAGPRQRQFVMAGMCGGFTTFSIFSLETLQLLQAQRPLIAGCNVVVSLLGWLGAVWLGHAVAARLNRLRGT